MRTLKSVPDLPAGRPIPLGRKGTRLDWSGLAERWLAAFGTPMPRINFWVGLPKLDPAQLRMLGFYYASGDKPAPRVDRNVQL